MAQLDQRAKTTVVTHNIDGLHQSAGSKNVLEIHGSLLEVVDVSSQKLIKRFNRDDLVHIADTLRKYSSQEISLFSFLRQLRRSYPLDWRGRHRPNLVLFGDAMAEPAWSQACQVKDCGVFLSVGTSGEVFPAAMLPHDAAKAGATVIAIDPQRCDVCWLQGTAGEILPKLVSDAFRGEA